MRAALLFVAIILFSCGGEKPVRLRAPVQIMTLDPGHFHAALVQKMMYPEMDSTVYVYAPEGKDVDWHLERINSYNAREKDPTHWIEKVYRGPDFFQKMIEGHHGNVVVLSGNNQKKTDYVLRSLSSGLHVFSDKPMAISTGDYRKLKQAFEVAAQNKLLLYDIMTERFEITTVLQRELSRIPEIFGELKKGSPGDPAISKESVHHFYKFVSGSVLTRPAWFLDVSQQGEGIVDVTTHLVDLVQWECFPEQALDTTDVQLNSARRWITALSKDEFKTITKLGDVPSYLEKNIKGDSLFIYSNGEINYRLRDVHAKVSVTWKYKAPEGTGDTHFSRMQGSKSSLVIRQGLDEGFKPELYIEPATHDANFEKILNEHWPAIQAKFHGVELKKFPKGWQVVIPDSFREGHEAHFARVTEKFLEYLQKGNIPSWEVPNMITKYYTTTQALEMAKGR